jgi:hypothetical protein
MIFGYESSVMHKKRQKIDMTIKMREASYENFSNMTKRIVLSLNEDDDKEVFYCVLKRKLLKKM